ncbi:MAG: IS481 family transposase [Actinomycetota bacterium]|nr:IS481 family transposase [Actinomycetota bacterium]
MSRARLVITAVVVEGRGAREVARAYGVSPGWVSKLVARYRDEGEAAFEARSRRPHRSPRATPPEVNARIVELRRALLAGGEDAGAETIRWHLAKHFDTILSASTILRALRREGLVEPQPKKRPRSSYVRFCAELPNETWQADFTHYPLATGEDAEILTWLDDHARFALKVSAHRRVTGPIVLATFRAATDEHGVPASTLTDNGMVFTTRLSGGRGGRNGFESELRRLGVTQKSSRPNHPTTCGEVERFQQAMKRWLRAQPVQPETLADLQELLDTFVDRYNTKRPHRSLPEQVPPATAYRGRPKATPGDRTGDAHDRVRRDVVDPKGRVTLRVGGRLHHIGIGMRFSGTRVLLLVHDLEVRVVDATTGELLRSLVVDPTKDYQPTGEPPGPKPRR